MSEEEKFDYLNEDEILFRHVPILRETIGDNSESQEAITALIFGYCFAMKSINRGAFVEYIQKINAPVPEFITQALENYENGQDIDWIELANREKRGM